MTRQPSSETVEQSSDAVLHFKDEILDLLAEEANVAQFVSFTPDLRPRFSRVSELAPNHRFLSVPEAVRTLLASSPEHSINIRSFKPDYPKSSDFLYGLTSAEDAVAHIYSLAGIGLYTIINETIDVHDGGVSGVALSDVIEFAPDATPRAVEHPGVATLPRNLGIRVIETVYGSPPSLKYSPDCRVEFSVHPLKRGHRHEHTIVWEIEQAGYFPLRTGVSWPNLFSRFLGDKTYGLLIASCLGLPVPLTTVISRRVAAYRFGETTGTGEFWTRTCPAVQQPGRFTTRRGWIDPFRLLQNEDPDHAAIAAILSQEGVDAKYSGSLAVGSDASLIVEGVMGQGDPFMKGELPPETLPPEVEGSVRDLYNAASAKLGPVRLEWVYDGERAWVVQLHTGATESTGRTIYPGEAISYRRFLVPSGISALYAMVAEIKGTNEGIILAGNVGVTSHMGDVLRRAKIPSRIEPS